jgi:hypothetical protein
MNGRCGILAVVLLLSSCGVPTDPERSPVILACSGTSTAKGANGDQEKERKREVYRIDGTKGVIEQWDDKSQAFGSARTGLTLSPTEARFSQDMPALAGITSARTVTFDRVSGTVVDENLFSNGGSVTFEATCKPVNDATTDRKF